MRGITAQTLAAVAVEEQVIPFAERVRCLRQLARTVRERHGVHGQVGDGAVGAAEFQELKRGAARGSSRSCASRGSGTRATTSRTPPSMPPRSPWLPSGLEQRVGRAARPGAARSQVQTYSPYIRGGGIEHVVPVLARRGAEPQQILDSFEGVRTSESTVAMQLSTVNAQVAERKDHADYAATPARLRVAASFHALASGGCEQIAGIAEDLIYPTFT